MTVFENISYGEFFGANVFISFISLKEMVFLVFYFATQNLNLYTGKGETHTFFSIRTFLF